MIRLTGHNVAIKPKFYENKTESGLLYIPDDSIRRANQGTVSIIGDKVTTVSVGDFVLFSGYSGTTIHVDGIVLILMHEEFLTCKIDEELGEIPGLYLKDTFGINSFFPATHDAVIAMLNDAREALDVTAPPPPKEAYDEH